MIRKEDLRSVPLACMTIAMLWGLLAVPAGAVWHTLLSEHFSGSPQTFPWGNWTLNPNRNWYQSGPPYVWGIQDVVYHANGFDTQSLWCVGLPPNLSPSEDDYPPNTNSWARWGPIDLSRAVAARATFYYYCITEPGQDYARWGAWPNNSTWNMYEAGRRSGAGSPQWYTFSLNFDSLQTPAGGDTSLLGDNSVWLVFHFFSDGDNLVGIGAFIDELSIAWDDGTFDLQANSAGLADPDSTPITTAVVGDTIRFSLYWTAEGSGATPDFDITCQLDGQPFYSERRNIDIGESQQVSAVTYSTPWVVTPDSHTVAWMLDASQEVVEAVETNNDTSLAFLPLVPNMPPSIEVTRPTWGDTAANQFVIRWVDDDPDDDAYINLYWRFDTLGFDGTPIPGALGISEDDEADSFLWNVSGLPETAIWVLALISDGTTPVFDFSAGPLIVDHDWTYAGEPPSGHLPQDFALQSIYPNPFNSSTVLHLAVPRTAPARVQIFDLLGRLRDVPFQGSLPAGYHDLPWTPRDLPSGLYLVEFDADGHKMRTKAVYLK